MTTPGSINSVFYVSLPVFEPKSQQLFGVIAIEVDLYAFIEHLHQGVLKDIVFYVSNSEGDIIFAPEFSELKGVKHRIQQLFPTLEPYVKQANQVNPVSQISKGVKLFQHKNQSTNASLAYFTSLEFSEDLNIEPLLILIENSNQAFIDAI